jgi:hypothetical protein
LEVQVLDGIRSRYSEFGAGMPHSEAVHRQILPEGAIFIEHNKEPG